MKLKDLKNKKILILGLGREGESSFLFLRKKFPEKILGVADVLEFKDLPFQVQKIIQKDKKVRVHFGKDYLKSLKNYNVIIKSPGIAPNKIKPFLKRGQIITSQTEIFFQECQGKIIGVTGTKGKSTTATLIYKILKNGGFKVYLVGNIGKPPLFYLEKFNHQNIFVYELSSHQLFGLRKSPQISVFLNIYPEHLDYYQSFQEYFKAKQNIALHQKEKDYFIFNCQKELRRFARKVKSQKIPFCLSKKPLVEFYSRQSKIPNGCWVQRGDIILIFNFKKEKILKVKNVPLLGKFNLLNVMPAIIVGKIFNVSPKVIERTIRTFRGLPHRLEFVGKFKGIKFYNNSLATLPEATIEAIESLGKNLQTILLGGFDRGVSFHSLAQKLWQSKIKNIILFPESGLRIWQEILATEKKGRKKFSHVFLVQNMKDAVKLSFQYTEKDKICLLSPASPSFGLFKDYKERGNLFKKYVRYFGKKKKALDTPN